MSAPAPPSPPLIGREAEAARLREFLSEPLRGSAALALVGDPGIGKSALWRHAALKAVDYGFAVLSARPAEAEREMAFSVLGDLLREDHDRLAILPPPQRRAFEVALLDEEAHTPPSPRAMGLGLLRLLENLAADNPVLVTVDDAQWIDGSSAIVLSFALRRLGALPVRLLVTTRPDSWEAAAHQLGLHQWPPQLVESLPVGGLPFIALGRLINEALGIQLTRPALRRLDELTRGNPYHALQVAPLLAEAPAAEPWSLPVPDTPAAAILARLRRLPAWVKRDMGVFSAASPQALQSIREDGPMQLRRSLEAAIGQGMFVVASGRPQFSHPLIPSVAYASLAADQRQSTHRRLAELAVDPGERARHRAAASAGPDEKVATELVAAAEREASRGAPEAAGALLELAATMSPDAEDRYRRLMDAADAFDLAGLRYRAGDLLARVLSSPLAGRQHHRARISLATRVKGLLEMEGLLTALLREKSLEPSGRAEAYEARAMARFNLGDLTGAIADSKAELASAEEAKDSTVTVRAATNVAWRETYAAPPLPEPLRRAQELRGGVDYLGYGADPDLVVALRDLYLDRIASARAGIDALIALATRRGDDGSLAGYHFHAAEVEVRAGAFAAANEHGQLSLEITRAIGSNEAASLFAAAWAAAHLGLTDDAKRYATEGLATAEASGDWIFRLQNATVLGFVDLSIGLAHAAAARLAPIPHELLAHGFREPSVIPAWPNAIEALIKAGDTDEAAELVPTYLDLADEFDCPWARATARRCNGLLAASRGDLPSAEAILREAAETHADVVSPFERARTLLTLGSVLRRQRKRREAREIFGRAQEAFSSGGATVWAEHARHEAARIRGRAGDLPGLSVTELSVARMVADGRTNREVAAALFLAERTVEANLSRIYLKLGVRSRTELTRWMADQPDGVVR